MPVRCTTRKFYPQSVCCRNDLSASSQPRSVTVALIGSSTIVAERYAPFCHRFGDMSQTRPIIVLKQTGDHTSALWLTHMESLAKMSRRSVHGRNPGGDRLPHQDVPARLNGAPPLLHLRERSLSTTRRSFVRMRMVRSFREYVGSRPARAESGSDNFA